jgi:hypothetical protein
MQHHGFTGEALFSLSRRAAHDALKKHGAYLDEQRFEELADYMLEVGVRYAARYEPGHGIAIGTFLYRRMRIRYIDWLRLTLGDTRGKTPSRRHPAGGFVSCRSGSSTAPAGTAAMTRSTSGSTRWARSPAQVRIRLSATRRTA